MQATIVHRIEIGLLSLFFPSNLRCAPEASGCLAQVEQYFLVAQSIVDYQSVMQKMGLFVAHILLTLLLRSCQ